MIHQRKPHNRKLYCLLLSEPKSGAFPCKHKAGKGGRGKRKGAGGIFFFLPDVFHPSPPPTSKCLVGQVSPVILELCISPLPVVSMPISYAPAARALTLCCFNHSINQASAVISTLALTATRKPVTSSGHIISH